MAAARKIAVRESRVALRFRPTARFRLGMTGV